MKNTYNAVFSNGTELSRKSEREYTHAYIVTVDNGAQKIRSGFSSSKEKAEKAANASTAGYGSEIGGKFVKYSDRGPVAEIVPVSKA